MTTTTSAAATPSATKMYFSFKNYYLHELCLLVDDEFDPETWPRICLPQVMMDRASICRLYDITDEVFDAVMGSRPIVPGTDCRSPHAPGAVDVHGVNGPPAAATFDAIAFGLVVGQAMLKASPRSPDSISG